MTKKQFKKSALSERLKASTKQPVRVVTDARVLDLRGPAPNVEVTVPLELLPAWMEFHRVDVCGGDRNRCVVMMKRLP